MLRRLIFANLVAHKVRFALTLAAIALSVSLVVSVTSGYASMEAAVLRFLSVTQGQTDVFVSHEAVRDGVPASIVEMLQQDPDVERVHPRLQGSSIVLNENKKPVGFGPMEIQGIDRPRSGLNLELGEWFEGDSGNFAVVDQVAARALRGGNATDETQPLAEPGTQFILPGVNKALKLKLVGVIRKPAFFASLRQTIYVPLKTLQEFTGDTHLSKIEVDLKPGVPSDAFVSRWQTKLKQVDPLLSLRTRSDKREEFDKNLQGVRIMSYLGGMVSMLAATFIVFSTLSMGVSERQRTLAMLRAIGAFKSQLAVLVISEGILICALGVIIGVPLGFGWLSLLMLQFDSLFAAGMVISKGGVILSIAVTMLAALLASFLPAYAAMRTDPLEAMSPLASRRTSRAPVGTAMIGLCLASLDSIALFAPWDRWLAGLGLRTEHFTGREFSFYAHFVIGIPGIMLGFFLLSPLFVWMVERIVGPILATILNVRFSLLKQQVSASIWRAAGTSSALMVGLAILVVMQTQGRTMLGGWQLPTQFPDVFITAGLTGLGGKEQAELKKVEGIKEVMPIAIAAPGFGTGSLAIAKAAIIPDATMFFGVDPDLAFTMMHLDFREGTPEEASRMLKLGNHIVITEEFRQLKNLHVGDKLSLSTKTGPKDFTIAGVVWSPGIDVMVSMFDLDEQFERRTAFSVFGSVDDAAKEFGAERPWLFAANIGVGLERQHLLSELRHRLGEWNLSVGDVRQIKHAILQTFERLLLLASTVAFAAMAVASLGVTNTIMASVRSRQWQFGVLRSIGVTRGGLMRLVLAEGVLIGAIGCALGLTAGLVMSINAKQLAVVILGYDPPLQIPWTIIAVGTAITFTVTLLASFWPARSVAKTEVLGLLQAGRAAG